MRLRRTPSKAEKLEALWYENPARKMAVLDKAPSEPNAFLNLLLEAYRATREPIFWECYRISLSYGLGNFKGSVRRYLQRIAKDVFWSVTLPVNLSGKRPSSAQIAAREGVKANSFGAAAKQVLRASKRDPGLLDDANTGGILLVGVAQEIDALHNLHRDVNDVSDKAKTNQFKTELYFNRARAVQSKIPEQITLKAIRWVADNRAARAAIAEGRLVLLSRAVCPLGIQSVEIIR